MTEGEYAAVYSITYPVASRAYRCDACKTIIKKGARYSAHRFLYDGEWAGHRQCARCALHWQALRDDPTRNTDYGCWPSPELDCGDYLEPGDDDNENDNDLIERIWEVLTLSDKDAATALVASRGDR